jgi:hypothetical protein
MEAVSEMWSACFVLAANCPNCRTKGKTNSRKKVLCPTKVMVFFIRKMKVGGLNEMRYSYSEHTKFESRPQNRLPWLSYFLANVDKKESNDEPASKLLD